MKVILLMAVILTILIESTNSYSLRRYGVPQTGNQMRNTNTMNSRTSGTTTSQPGVQVQSVVRPSCSPCRGKCEVNDAQTCVCRTDFGCLYG
ncbi:UNVERIFIED_CONTAM: hypothetical protein RMT77_001531 [Armadillidium vulgare]